MHHVGHSNVDDYGSNRKDCESAVSKHVNRETGSLGQIIIDLGTHPISQEAKVADVNHLLKS